MNVKKVTKHYKSLQMDRGAALNCRVVHNWDSKKDQSKKSENNDQETSENDRQTVICPICHMERQNSLKSTV